MASVRMNLTLTENANEQLKKLSEEIGTTKSELIRKALKLYALAEKEEKKGNHMAFIDDRDKIQAKVVGL